MTRTRHRTPKRARIGHQPSNTGSAEEAGRTRTALAGLSPWPLAVPLSTGDVSCGSGPPPADPAHRSSGSDLPKRRRQTDAAEHLLRLLERSPRERRLEPIAVPALRQRPPLSECRLGTPAGWLSFDRKNLMLPQVNTMSSRHRFAGSGNETYPSCWSSSPSLTVSSSGSPVSAHVHVMRPPAWSAARITSASHAQFAHHAPVRGTRLVVQSLCGLGLVGVGPL
jgi:hypothetical protein